MKFYLILQRACFLLCCSFTVQAADSNRVFERHFDGVLGTSLDITIVTDETEQIVELAVSSAVAEIGKLEQILSTYRADSELMRLNHSGSTNAASAELLEIISACEQWYSRSEGKFSCKLGDILRLWDEAERAQEVPDRITVRAVARKANQASLDIDVAAATVDLPEGVTLDPSGLAKGYIIDRALTVLRAFLSEDSAVKLDIGGDAYYWQSPPAEDSWQVGIADPIETADNQRFIATLAVNSKAVTASGHNSRTRHIGHREFSHIFTPRDGWPVTSGTASIVIAPDVMSADAIATALTVQDLNDGIDWVNSLPEVEAMVIDSQGVQLTSLNWSDYVAGTNAREGGEALDLTLEYVLPEFAVASYNRPYLAIWITDTNQKALKNLLLLGETERWARENTRWWRRVGRRNPQLLDGVARATRGPGEYTLKWDGLDDFGAIVPPGDYLLHLEASRENGGSTYKSIPITLGSSEMNVRMEPEGELGTIVLHIKGQ
ncbi:DUF2271 domain-containing protein [Gammaproteobacteria bacterium]|nr:DUF2271 domain-containing protein [Gammaproteobacteria bacterium]